MKNACETCHLKTPECIKDISLCKNDEVVYCENCSCRVNWGNIPDDKIVGKFVYLGECHGTHYEYEVQGWICDCGHYNEV